MTLLLDTHTWLWFVLGDAGLSPAARALIEDSSNEKLVSPASFWEVAKPGSGHRKAIRQRLPSALVSRAYPSRNGRSAALIIGTALTAPVATFRIPVASGARRFRCVVRPGSTRVLA